MPVPCTVKTLGGHQYSCFFDLTIHVIGGKWKSIILYHLALDGTQRFNALKRDIPDVTDRMLVRQLRELEADGLVTRTVAQVVPPKVEYALTELGASLIPLLLEMRQWGIVFEGHLCGGAPLSGPGYEPLAPPTFKARPEQTGKG